MDSQIKKNELDWAEKPTPGGTVIICFSNEFKQVVSVYNNSSTSVTKDIKGKILKTVQYL